MRGCFPVVPCNLCLRSVLLCFWVLISFFFVLHFSHCCQNVWNSVCNKVFGTARAPSVSNTFGALKTVCLKRTLVHISSTWICLVAADCRRQLIKKNCAKHPFYTLSHQNVLNRCTQVELTIIFKLLTPPLLQVSRMNMRY